MKPITLSTRTKEGETLEATFLPEKGMTLASYKLGEIEAIDQSTKGDFDKARNGLGALIGPHFYARPDFLVPKIDHEFSHEKVMREKGKVDIFTHGVGRYASWNAEQNGNTIHAELSGEDKLEGIPLSEIEGQNFKMVFDVNLSEEGLKLDISVVSDRDSVVGFHYYYAIGNNGNARVRAAVQDTYLDNLDGNRKKPLPADWEIDAQRMLTYPLNQDTDCTFYPYPDLLNGEIVLETETHQLSVRTSCPSAENSWQVWHPKGATFACIEPISSQNPRRPNLTVSEISATLNLKPLHK